MKNTLRLTDTIRGVTVKEILGRISQEFPDGFRATEASSFLEKIFGRRMSFHHIYSNISKRGAEHIQKQLLLRPENPRNSVYKYTITGIETAEEYPPIIRIQEYNIDSIVDKYSNNIDPIVGEGSLREELTKRLRSTLLNYLDR